METGLRALFFVAASLLVCLLLQACTKEQPEHKFTGRTMGTTYHITVVNAPASVNPLDLQQEIDNTLAGLDLVFSTYKSNSELSRLNQAPVNEAVAVTPELFQVVELALSISESSGGAYDITVGPLVDLWGFGKLEVLQLPPDVSKLQAAHKKVCYRCLQLSAADSTIRKTAPVEIDLSSVAKGYAVDQVAVLLARHGIANYLVEIGGEVVTRGTNAEGQSWALGIESPKLAVDSDPQTSVQQIIRLQRGAVATSGDYRNYLMIRGKQYSHIIDPATGYPVEHNPASVTVIADNCALADAWATAFTVLGVERGMAIAREKNIAVYFVSRDSSGELVVAMTETFRSYLEQN